jgi:hypothetical protein
MEGRTHHDLIATRDKIRSTTVERDYKKAPITGVFYFESLFSVGVSYLNDSPDSWVHS